MHVSRAQTAPQRSSRFTLRCILALGFAALAGGGQAAAANQAMFAETNVYLTGEPKPVAILVQDIGALRGFEVELTYDAERVAVTAVGVGSLVSAVRPDAQMTVIAASSGRLTVGLDLPEAPVPTAADGGGAAAAPPALFPQGSGELLTLTLAPLKQTDSPVELKVVALRLRGAGDAQDQDLACPPTQVTVAQDPTAAQRAAYLEQARALAPAGVLGGLLSGSWLPGFSARPSPELAWLGLVLAGMAVVGVAWLLGKRPPNGAGADE